MRGVPVQRRSGKVLQNHALLGRHTVIPAKGIIKHDGVAFPGRAHNGLAEGLVIGIYSRTTADADAVDGGVK